MLAFTEFVYDDLGESRFSGRFELSPRINITFRPTLLDWTSGIRVQFPVDSWRVRPYLAAGGGIAHLKRKADGGAWISVSDSSNHFTYHLDAGSRVFVTGWFGVAPEFRVVRIPDDTFYRVLISAVFRLD